MSEDRRDVLQVLRYELNFLEQGGYGQTLRPGRLTTPLRDTLSCLNFGDPMRPHACRECLLSDFVPEERRTEDVPCHFIPLDPEGTTVSDLLPGKDIKKLEAAMKNWLLRTIAIIESQRPATTAD